VAAGATITYSVLFGTGAINTPPTITTSTPTAGTTYSVGNSLNLSGTIADSDGTGTGLMQVCYSFDNGTQTSETGVTDSPTAYSFNYAITVPSSFTTGTHVLHVWAMDSQGATSAMQNISLNIINDTTPPTGTYTLSKTATTNGTVTINFTATDKVSPPLNCLTVLSSQLQRQLIRSLPMVHITLS
jgi:chitinase